MKSNRRNKLLSKQAIRTEAAINETRGVGIDTEACPFVIFRSFREQLASEELETARHRFSREKPILICCHVNE